MRRLCEIAQNFLQLLTIIKKYANIKILGGACEKVSLDDYIQANKFYHKQGFWGYRYI
jgi:hypothetical protein